MEKQGDALLDLIESVEAKLHRDGLEIAERFFAERLADFGTHIEEWFEDSRIAWADFWAKTLIAG